MRFLCYNSIAFLTHTIQNDIKSTHSSRHSDTCFRRMQFKMILKQFVRLGSRSLGFRRT